MTRHVYDEEASQRLHLDVVHEIAAALHLSVRTVERHFHNIYAKLGVSGRAARTAAVSRLLAVR